MQCVVFHGYHKSDSVVRSEGPSNDSHLVLYWIQFMDKTTLGSAAILGIQYAAFRPEYDCRSDNHMIITLEKRLTYQLTSEYQCIYAYVSEAYHCLEDIIGIISNSYYHEG